MAAGVGVGGTTCLMSIPSNRWIAFQARVLTAPKTWLVGSACGYRATP